MASALGFDGLKGVDGLKGLKGLIFVVNLKTILGRWAPSPSSYEWGL